MPPTGMGSGSGNVYLATLGSIRRGTTGKMKVACLMHDHKQTLREPEE